MKRQKIYVDAQWIKKYVESHPSEEYLILECSWGNLTEESEYVKGHIQGAVHINTDEIEREDTNWNIISPDEFKTVLKKYGITKDKLVICYGKSGVDAADDRVATALIWAGVEQVKCLDGGLEQWVKLGYELEKKINLPIATKKEFGGDVPMRPEVFISIDEVSNLLKTDCTFKLASVRSYEEYIGKKSGYEDIELAGEPKGAVWVHNTDVYDYCGNDGKMTSFDIVEKYFKEAGITRNNKVAFYCGTGWRACIPFLMCIENSWNQTCVFDGGWFEWHKDDTKEVQIGNPMLGNCEYMTINDLKKIRM